MRVESPAKIDVDAHAGHLHVGQHLDQGSISFKSLDTKRAQVGSSDLRSRNERSALRGLHRNIADGASTIEI